MAGGYTGKYCIVDLSTGSTEIVEPGDGFYRKYLSGYGLGAARGGTRVVDRESSDGLAVPPRHRRLRIRWRGRR